MDIWRVQLKPAPAEGITYQDVLNFCKDKGIIGVGWYLVETHEDDYDALKSAIERIPEYAGSNGKHTAAIKAVNAVRSMKTGDLVWTRLAENAADYYLCRVGDKLWKDRNVTDEHRRHDIGNFVSAEWVRVGTEDMVPGKVVNNFCARGTAQHVYEVERVSKYIWNKYSGDNLQKYEMTPFTMDDFWNAIGSEELESLILLYLQTKGYYIYSSTLKISTARYEVIMVSHDGKHKCLPQVKRNTTLDVADYIEDVKGGDEVYLFTTSEQYGSTKHDKVHCISKCEIEDFISSNYSILPESIRYWVDMTK